MSHRHHHHHVPSSARISLVLSRHPSLLSIASGWSSGLHPVSTQSCCMWFELVALLLLGVHNGTSPMSPSLLLQQYPPCLVRLIFIVFVMGGMWLYSCCFVGFASRTCWINSWKDWVLKSRLSNQSKRQKTLNSNRLKSA